MSLNELAQKVAEYHKALIAQGVHYRDALELAIAYQGNLIWIESNGEPGKEPWQ